MKRPTRPISTHARGHSASNSNAQRLSVTLRSKLRSRADRDVFGAAMASLYHAAPERAQHINGDVCVKLLKDCGLNAASGGKGQPRRPCRASRGRLASVNAADRVRGFWRRGHRGRAAQARWLARTPIIAGSRQAEDTFGGVRPDQDLFAISLP